MILAAPSPVCHRLVCLSNWMKGLRYTFQNAPALGRDYFYHDPAGHRMTGERSGKVYRLGDRIGIKVVRVNLDDRKIDLEPLEKVGGDAPARKPKSKTRKSKSRSKTGPKSKVDTKPDTQSSDKPKKRRRRRRG